jgi:hypothetical protein
VEWIRDVKGGGEKIEGKVLGIGDSVVRSPRPETGVVREWQGAAFGSDSVRISEDHSKEGKVFR